MPSNKAAWLDEKGMNFRVGDASIPEPGPDEITIRNAAIAVNPVDTHMQEIGIFVKVWPAILGSDVAGYVHEVGSNVTRFKKGDRVVGHTITLNTGRPEHGAFALYSVAPAAKSALLPESCSFAEGAVLPLALGCTTVGLLHPDYLGLPYPSLNPKPSGKIVIIYGGSSSVGTIATMLAVAGGCKVIAITSARNSEYCRNNGAGEVFDYRDSALVDKVITAVQQSGELVGILDAISEADTIANDVAILDQFGGGRISCTHPPPEDLPVTIKATMIWPINDLSDCVWEEFVTPALENGQLKCLPEPLVVGHGLESVQAALAKIKEGVSARKVVVEV